MAKLLDQYGQPIDTGLLKNTIAGPQQYGVRTIGTANSFSGLDPARLADILRAAEATDPRAYLELAEEMEEKYLHYAAQLATRKRAVCGLEWQVVPASERLRDRKIAEQIEALVPLLEESLFDILDSLGKGYSVTEIAWENQGAAWLPVALERRDPRWFQFDRIDGRTLRLRDIGNPIDGLALAPGKFITCTGGAKSGLPVRGGLARAAAYAYLFHNFSLRDWVTFCERYGMPLRLGRYHEGALPGDIDILFSAVRGLGADAAAILPKGMEIEFPEIKSATANADLWEKLLAYLDAPGLEAGHRPDPDRGQRPGRQRQLRAGQGAQRGAHRHPARRRESRLRSAQPRPGEDCRRPQLRPAGILPGAAPAGRRAGRHGRAGRQPRRRWSSWASR